MKRESFKSRLGFLLVSAGCAIGIGNVWRFPYVAGQNGGGIFVLFYLIFLIAMGLPVLTMEFAVGRASRKSAVWLDMPVFPQTTRTRSAATLRKLIITPTTLKVVTIGSLLRSTPTMESRGQRSTAPRSNGPCK